MTIGIIGASGQVGTEVCLFLKTYPDVRVVAIVRTKISGAILRRCGVDVRVGSFATPEESARLVGDCDVVVDFSVVPSGGVAAILAHYKTSIEAALRHSRPDTRYVFISSISAFGMGDGFTRAKHYWISHRVYAYTKRHAERLARREAASQRKPVFVLRLGHVHGVLQRVSHETRELVNGPHTAFEYPESPSFTVFCFSIAEALVNIGAGRETPGSYTLVSEPAWSWKDVLEYYMAPGQRKAIALRPLHSSSWLQRTIAGVTGAALGVVSRYQETLSAHVLHRVPTLEAKVRGYYYRRRARNQIREWQDQTTYRAAWVHEGVFPGRRLSSLSDSRSTMAEKTEQVRRMVDGLGAEVTAQLEHAGASCS